LEFLKILKMNEIKEDTEVGKGKLKKKIEVERELKPNFISGFTNADGSFEILFARVNTMKYKYRVSPIFVLSQMDRVLLDKINGYFNNKGHIVQDKRSKCYNLRFNSMTSAVGYIIPHFDRYPLRGKKLLDYEK
jgi:hypothetical protein